jgi:hypothetical protein
MNLQHLLQIDHCIRVSEASIRDLEKTCKHIHDNRCAKWCNSSDVKVTSCYGSGTC